MLLLAACGQPLPLEAESPPELAATNQRQELYGQISDAEWALDAPWRLEPEVTYVFGTCGLKSCPTYRYGAVPLSLSIRDAYQSALGEWLVTSVTVDEEGTGLPPQTIPLASFHEVERTVGRWGRSEAPTYQGPPHTVCRRWQGEDCASFGVLTDTSEWDATVLYTLRQPTPAGERVRLKLTLNLSNRYWQPGEPTTHTLTNTVFIVLGHQLPRFDSRWVYGDLHYHSQGSDNEGESGYSHRTTLQAMSALGLDFTFATEHASNSGQFDNYADFATPLVQGVDGTILRDMSKRRWAKLLEGLNGSTGANREVVSAPRRRTSNTLATPQLFLGGEVDVIPEIGTEDYFRSGLSFGNHKIYYWMSSCWQYPGYDELAWLGIEDNIGCPSTDRTVLSTPAYDTVTGVGVPGRYFLKDLQGPFERLFGRQHVLHLPSDPLDPEAFVTSSTSRWGGATRRLETLLTSEYTVARKGVTFLAHPADHASGSDRGRLGPDIMPFSPVQLDDAFRNQHMLGLELWNEDTRAKAERSSPNDLVPTDAYGDWGPHDANSLFGALHNGLATFDQLLLWSVDPVRRQNVSWLAPGAFRKIFLSGGSDAHGDLNFSRKGYMGGLGSVNDTAMGKPRNLVMVPQRTGPLLSGGGLSTRAVSQGDVVEALRAGQFIATDGPIVRIAFDTNANGIIDDGDVPMGGDTTWDIYSPSLRLIVEWRSTPEMGRVTQLELTVNAFSNSTRHGLTYAPLHHGVRASYQRPGAVARTYTSSAGERFTELDDHYFLDPTGQLRVEVPNAEGFSGRRVISLDPQRFKTGRIWTANVPVMTCDNNPEEFQSLLPPDQLPETGDCDGTRLIGSIADVRPPDALIIRALARTSGVGEPDPWTGHLHCDEGRGDCEPRLGFTNPLWARYRAQSFQLSP